MSVALELDEQALANLPFGPGKRERHMQIELACRFYGHGWLTLGQGARMANLDHYAFGVALAERGIPRPYGIAEAQEDLAHARRQEHLSDFKPRHCRRRAGWKVEARWRW